MRLRVSVALLFAVACVSVPSAAAGGPFTTILGVGADGAWRTIALRPTGEHSEAALAGKSVPVPNSGYVRVYSFVGGTLPGIPGRFYPRRATLCLYWREPVSNCSRLGAAGIKLLSPLSKLPLRVRPPTVPIEVRHRGRVLRYANGNIFAALELALERRGSAHPSVPRDAIPLAVRWRGPAAIHYPEHLLLTPVGVYSARHLFPLGRDPWCYLAINLPHVTAQLIEATSRVCR
jgi:hypothetical protein